MKPETADYLAKARECLDAAIKINTFSLPQVAAKEAYLAAYHAAHAFIFERTGKVVKSHVFTFDGSRNWCPLRAQMRKVCWVRSPASASSRARLYAN